jgi:predicted homoserine dehydrogenase-like protein
MIALQLCTPVPGIRLVAISNRTIDKARKAYSNAGIEEVKAVDNVGDLEDRIEEEKYSIVENWELLCKAANIDLIIDVTGTVEFGARLAVRAIEHGKHLVLVNAELDSSLGPILKFKADRQGVVITNTDGDEPGVAMTLLRYVQSLGLRPVAAGNLKGLIDKYRTPETQREFAAKYEQDAVKVTSFADGTKLSMECTILANATGFRVGQRGMYGPKCTHVKEIAKLLPHEQLLNEGLVDYALGAEPHTGAFVVVYEDHPKKQKELAYYKMGDGPFYVFIPLTTFLIFNSPLPSGGRSSLTTLQSPPWAARSARC